MDRFIDDIFVLVIKITRKNLQGTPETSCFFFNNKIVCYNGNEKKNVVSVTNNGDFFWETIFRIDKICGKPDNNSPFYQENNELLTENWIITRLAYGGILEEGIEGALIKNRTYFEIKLLKKRCKFLNSKCKENSVVNGFEIKNKKYVIALTRNGVVCQKKSDWKLSKKTGLFVGVKNKCLTGEIKTQEGFSFQAIDYFRKFIDKYNLFIKKSTWV